MSRILVLMLTLTITCRASAAEPPEDFTNSIGMKFKLIPAGEFMMGSPEDGRYRRDNETRHRVRITRPYYLGIHEVTQGQWEEVMGTRPWEGERDAKSDPEHAVSHVNWAAAVGFCRKLSSKEGRACRLPTEAEWEYACRAGSTTSYCFGDNEWDVDSYAWYLENTFEVDEKYAHPVGRKQANAWGLYDVHGNVNEWCSDWYEEDYYENSPVDDPAGASTGEFRVSRGGCCGTLPRHFRSAYRSGYLPDSCYYGSGFRVVQVPRE